MGRLFCMKLRILFLHLYFSLLIIHHPKPSSACNKDWLFLYSYWRFKFLIIWHFKFHQNMDKILIKFSNFKLDFSKPIHPIHLDIFQDLQFIFILYHHNSTYKEKALSNHLNLFFLLSNSNHKKNCFLKYNFRIHPEFDALNIHWLNWLIQSIRHFLKERFSNDLFINNIFQTYWLVFAFYFYILLYLLITSIP